MALIEIKAGITMVEFNRIPGSNTVAARTAGVRHKPSADITMGVLMAVLTAGRRESQLDRGSVRTPLLRHTQSYKFLGFLQPVAGLASDGLVATFQGKNNPVFFC
jgi:hypothetical protein